MRANSGLEFCCVCRSKPQCETVEVVIVRPIEDADLAMALTTDTMLNPCGIGALFPY